MAVAPWYFVATPHRNDLPVTCTDEERGLALRMARVSRRQRTATHTQIKPPSSRTLNHPLAINRDDRLHPGSGGGETCVKRGFDDCCGDLIAGGAGGRGGVDE